MQKAFTLIELLVVVLIIGILAAVALPQYQVAVGKTQFTEGLMAAENLYKAEKVYHMANNEYTKDLTKLDYDVTNPHITISIGGEGVNAFISVRYKGAEAYLIKYLASGKRECRVASTASKTAKQICASLTGVEEKERTTYFAWDF